LRNVFSGDSGLDKNVFDSDLSRKGIDT